MSTFRNRFPIQKSGHCKKIRKNIINYEVGALFSEKRLFWKFNYHKKLSLVLKLTSVSVQFFFDVNHRKFVFGMLTTGKIYFNTLNEDSVGFLSLRTILVVYLRVVIIVIHFEFIIIITQKLIFSYMQN